MDNTRGLWRGKRVDNGDWVEGYYVSNGKDLHYIITDKFVQHLVDPSTLGEFTGVTDKNGKLIFEGDILEYQTGGLGLVCFGDHGFYHNQDNHRGFYVFRYGRKRCMYWGNPTYSLEIIGNIHDNPELLNGGETK